MIDQLIIGFDRALRTVFANAHTVRPVPGEAQPEAEMSEEERRHAAALMRVNHCGEICAQALYQGQALMSDNEGIKKALAGAAQEETEHLAWTERRIAELGGRKSLLNPLWYGGSLAIGMLAARFG
ncbi:MAG: 2-polyprenyl-3-methyl-6-methoxy-1,4-benzoquinone monooxygenase, partial [Zoogloea sp.]|nr:2-polyprenyl-3-methyl-6-methoxy-1,4-benzoquinone monooxygenase [Zoogloea sp.]